MLIKLNKLIKLLSILAGISGLIACHAGGANDYHTNEVQSQITGIQVPHGYITNDMEQSYPIPEIVSNRSESPGIEPPA
jgi:hypothetical protein